jgi:hypothetical protein
MEQFFNDLLARAPNDFDIATKVRELLAAVARRCLQPGANVEVRADTDYPLAYARNGYELNYLIDYAVDMGWFTDLAKSSRTQLGTLHCCLTPRGWEEVRHPARIDSTTVFVAMWFDPPLTLAYTDGIKPAIEDDCGYRPVRVDLEDTNNDDIVDEILAQIRGSRFVVADVTGHREGVYFEAGFAKGLGIPVIWTCRQKDFRDRRAFDTEHYNHILWSEPGDLRTKLANRIKASIGMASTQHAEAL